MQRPTQFRARIQTIHRMQNQFLMTREQRGKIVIDEFTGKRQIAGAQIKHGGSRRREQEIERIGHRLKRAGHLFTGKIGGRPLRSPALNETKIEAQ